MISLFYRAWANARPTVSYDRPDSDRFSFYVGSLLGVGGEVFKQRDALNDRAKRYYAGHFSATSQSPGGLCAIISDILQTSVDVIEFVGEWMAIQRRDQTRLGIAPNTASLGESALLGAFVWGCQHKFRLILGPLTLAQYLALLPGGTILPQLIAIVRNYVGDAFVWEAQLILDKNQVPAELTLGKSTSSNAQRLNGEAQLGWSMWLGPRARDDDADDLLLNPFINSNS
jgi:type VI secretion system protein ImpH